jgi:hypothetical protein
MERTMPLNAEQYVIIALAEDDAEAVTFLGGPFSEADAVERRDEIFSETDDYYALALVPVHSIKTLETYNEENPEEEIDE